MALTATITLTAAGADTGPFNLLSDSDGYLVPFESGIAKSALLAGYTTVMIPDTATVVRVQSASSCTNFLNFTLVLPTTTTTTSTSTSTTTSTSTSTTTSTTTTSDGYNYYTASFFTCSTCGPYSPSSGVVRSTDALTIGKYYDTAPYMRINTAVGMQAYNYEIGPGTPYTNSCGPC